MFKIKYKWISNVNCKMEGTLFFSRRGWGIIVRKFSTLESFGICQMR